MLDLIQLARRLERAQAQQNERLTLAAGGTSLAVGGGYAHHRGPGHPLNQALGLVDPVSADELSAVEAFLGAPTVLELSPAADATLWPLLAARGYRVHQFQQLWVRELGTEASASAAEVVRTTDVLLLSQVVGAGFGETDHWQQTAPHFLTPLDVPGFVGCLALIDGEPAGGAFLGMVDGVALLAGDAVLPRFRGRGFQRALVHARLSWGLEAGCTIACASTLPIASQRSYEACGFRVAYPKLELVRG
jgi:GNAT superfamily N-acetyltransferase